MRLRTVRTITSAWMLVRTVMMAAERMLRSQARAMEKLLLFLVM